MSGNPFGTVSNLRNNGRVFANITDGSASAIVPATSSSQGGFVFMSQLFNLSDVDLSQNSALQVLQLDRVVLRNLLLPTTTSFPVAIKIIDTTFQNPLLVFPDTMTTCVIESTIVVDGAALAVALAASPALLHLSLSFFTSMTSFAIPNLTFPSLGFNMPNAQESPTFELLNFNGVTSVGNFAINSGWVIPDFVYQIINCVNCVSVGNVTLVTTYAIPIMEVLVYDNTLLTSIGNIALSNNFFLAIRSNPALTSIGTITIATPSGSPTLDFTSNAFPSVVISQILVDLDASGATNGSVDFTGNPGTGFGAQTPAGQAASLSLVGKGWTVTY